MQYATIQEADDFYSKVFNSGWEDISTEDKCLLLKNASLNIDGYQYAGKKKDENQEGEFPRIFCDGTESDENLVKKACILEALRIYKSGDNGIGITSSGDIKSFTLGDVDVDLDGADTTNAKQNPIDNILGRYMKGTSARILL